MRKFPVSVTKLERFREFRNPSLMQERTRYRCGATDFCGCSKIWASARSRKRDGARVFSCYALFDTSALTNLTHWTFSRYVTTTIYLEFELFQLQPNTVPETESYKGSNQKLLKLWARWRFTPFLQFSEKFMMWVVLLCCQRCNQTMIENSNMVVVLHQID